MPQKFFLNAKEPNRHDHRRNWQCHKEEQEDVRMSVAYEVKQRCQYADLNYEDGKTAASHKATCEQQRPIYLRDELGLSHRPNAQLQPTNVGTASRQSVESGGWTLSLDIKIVLTTIVAHAFADASIG